MKVGPTVRICLLSEDASDVTGALGGAGSGAAVVAAPFLPDAAFDFDGGCAIFFALSSVTMMSPCCWAAALSSMFLSASDQVWPAALQAQDGLNSERNLNALGEEV